MVETITTTVYVTSDGHEYALEKDALLHEQCLEAMAPLGSFVELESTQRIKHNIECVYAAREALLQICRSLGYASAYLVFNTPGKNAHPLGVIGRILSDGGGPLYHFWSRLMCIDEAGYEYQQPYFAHTAPINERSRLITIDDRTL